MRPATMTMSANEHAGRAQELLDRGGLSKRNLMRANAHANLAVFLETRRVHKRLRQILKQLNPDESRDEEWAEARLKQIREAAREKKAPRRRS